MQPDRYAPLPFTSAVAVNAGGLAQSSVESAGTAGTTGAGRTIAASATSLHAVGPAGRLCPPPE